MHVEYRNSATSTIERRLKRTRNQNFQLFMSVDVKKHSSGVTFMPSSVRKVVVGKRKGKGQLERIRLRGKNVIKKMIFLWRCVPTWVMASSFTRFF